MIFNHQSVGHANILAMAFEREGTFFFFFCSNFLNFFKKYETEDAIRGNWLWA